MKRDKKLAKMTAYAFVTAFVMIGTYNAVMISSESHISEHEGHFIKRLDEMNGVTVYGRKIAAHPEWKKLTKDTAIVNNNSAPVSKELENKPSFEAVESIPVAAVQEDLNLSLIEVIDQKRWKDGLADTQFSGSLVTNNGLIEEMSVSLPDTEGVSVAFSELSGNVFEYEFKGDIYSAILYQVDQKGYMVTFSNGPLEGMRLRFSSVTTEDTQYENMDTLVENNVEVGGFGDQELNPEDMTQFEEVTSETQQAQSFNFDSQKI